MRKAADAIPAAMNGTTRILTEHSRPALGEDERNCDFPNLVLLTNKAQNTWSLSLCFVASRYATRLLPLSPKWGIRFGFESRRHSGSPCKQHRSRHTCNSLQVNASSDSGPTVVNAQSLSCRNQSLAQACAVCSPLVEIKTRNRDFAAV